MPLFLLLLIVPLIEIFLFIEVGGLIGVWATIGIVVLTAILGSILLRRQGLEALRTLQTRLTAGENPGRLLADGAMILFAGALLLTPGFLTDATGFLLMVPSVRAAIWDRLARRLIVARFETRRTTRTWPGGETVEGEYEEVDPGPDSGPGPEPRPDPDAPGREPARRVGHERR